MAHTRAREEEQKKERLTAIFHRFSTCVRRGGRGVDPGGMRKEEKGCILQMRDAANERRDGRPFEDLERVRKFLKARKGGQARVAVGCVAGLHVKGKLFLPLGDDHPVGLLDLKNDRSSKPSHDVSKGEVELRRNPK